jgi:hypothetical protein
MEGRWGGGEPRKGKLAEGREGRGRLVFPLAQNFWDPWNGTWTDTSKERRRRGAGTDFFAKKWGLRGRGDRGPQARRDGIRRPAGAAVLAGRDNRQPGSERLSVADCRLHRARPGDRASSGGGRFHESWDEPMRLQKPEGIIDGNTLAETGNGWMHACRRQPGWNWQLRIDAT